MLFIVILVNEFQVSVGAARQREAVLVPWLVILSVDADEAVNLGAWQRSAS